MSSGNRVSLLYKKESTYNELPAGDLDTIAFISEALSGSPETTQSQKIVADRQPQGQVLTGLAAGGAIGFELGRNAVIDDFIEAGMFSSWAAAIALTGMELEVNTSTKKIIRGSGSWITDLIEVGDAVKLGGFANSENNVMVKITAVTALELTYVGPSTMVDEVTDADNDESVTRPSYVDIGTTKSSFSISKEFEDLTDKSILYRGAVVDTLEFSMAVKEIMTMSVGLLTAGYSFPVTLTSDGRTVNAAGNEEPLNASVDAGKITIDGAVAPYCIQSLSINLGNNHNPKDCMGSVSPDGYDEGGANVGVNLTTYLEDENFSLLDKKLTQEPFGVFFYTSNLDGGYAFDMPAIQVASDDPSVGGANQQVTMDLSGTAKKGDNGESALRIYKLD